MAKVYGVIIKPEFDVPTTQGIVSWYVYKTKIINCIKVSDITRGDPVRVVAGKKLPIGTEGIVKNVVINKYSPDISSNPSVFITLKDGKEVATVGKNLINLKYFAVNNKIFEAETTADLINETSKYVNEVLGGNLEEMWYINPMGNLGYVGPYDYFETEKDNVLDIKETEKGYKALISRTENNSEIYTIIEFGKEFKPGNTIKIEHAGIEERMRFMEGVDIKEEAIKLYTK